MTPRERVISTFEHQEPDRVPCWFGASPEFWEKAKQELKIDDEDLKLRLRDDFSRVFSSFVGPEQALNPDAVYWTPFGLERYGLGYDQPYSHPLAGADLKSLHDYFWPDPDWIDVSNIKSDVLQYKGWYAILGGEWAPYWHDAIDLGHDYSLKVMLHCCGVFATLIPSMIDAGLDGLHALQLSCTGIDLKSLKAEFGDKILFNGCIDSHHVMIKGTLDWVRRKIRDVIDIIKPGEGFVAGASQ